MKEKTELINTICNLLELEKEDIVIENPKDRSMGDYAIPCFTLAKKMRKSPNAIALEIEEKLDVDFIEKKEVVGGYLNIFIKREEIMKNVISEIKEKKENYGQTKFGEGRTVVIDYSAPNIAKPFSVGHLRSTVIGNALKKICLKTGYEVTGINHLGDWGTQFGKLISAYKRWGDTELIKENPIAELTKLYVRFHEEALENEELDDEARMYFKKLEDGDEECLELWKWFREESLKEFQKTYDLLGINDFDSYNGEAFYNDKMDPIIKELEEKNLLVDSEGAKVVLMDEFAPALIQKKDGATLYITRDLATAFYRKKTYDFYEALYVVGNEQQLHFAQLKEVIRKMGYDFYKDMHHINFGMILQGGKKMSTRKGKTVRLHDVLLEAIEKASLRTKTDEVSKQVGIGAVIFNDLKNYRTNDIEFDLDEILKFEGETGPYVQYTYARIQSLLEHNEENVVDYGNFEVNDLIWNLVFKLYNFSDIIEKAKKEYDPSVVAKYAISLAQDFSKFYAEERILDEDKNLRQIKLNICESVGIVIKECLNLLGVEAPKKM